MAASNVVILLVSQVVVATDRRIHLNKPVQEAELTRLPVRMIDIPCHLKYYGFIFSKRDLKQLRRGRKREQNYDVACSTTLGREHRFRREN